MPLDLERLLRPATVCLDLKSRDKESAIADLVDLLVAAGEVRDRQAVIDAVLEREGKLSTGMQHGVAIPHGKTDAVSDVVAALGVHRKGVEFQSLDGKPAHLIVVTVSPQSLASSHVQFLAQIGRILAVPGTRERLLKARSKDEVVSVFAGAARG